MKLSLFPHQRAAVAWMASREAKRKGSGQHSLQLDPDWRELPGRSEAEVEIEAQGGTSRPLWVSRATGELSSAEPRAPLFSAAPSLFGARGGLCCDEPGLGKTITALALMLRTAGALPEPPRGARVVSSAAGRFYTMPSEGDDGREERGTADASAADAAGGTAAASLPPPSSSSSSSRAGRPRRAAAQAVSAAGGRRPSAEDAALVRARVQVASAAARAAAERSRREGERRARASATAEAAAASEAAAVAATAAADAPPPPHVAAAAAAAAAAAVKEEGGKENVGLGEGGEEGAAAAAACEEEEEPPAPEATKPQPPPPAAAAAATTLWVACDLCSRWRALPPATAVDGAAPWICAMHPIREAASCSAPAEEPGATGVANDDPSGAATPTAVFVSSCDGWTSSSSSTTSSSSGDPKNENYWRSLLSENSRMADWPSAAWWLATSFEAALSSSAASASFSSSPSIRVPKEHRCPPGWAGFLHAAGLEPAPPPAPSSFSRGAKGVKRAAAAAVAAASAAAQQHAAAAAAAAAAASASAPGNKKRRITDSDAWAFVRVPRSLSSGLLTLDAAALRSALSAAAALGGGAPLAPLPSARPVFLSPATLLIVPASLEAHWADQVTRHVEAGRMRVAVLSDVVRESSLPSSSASASAGGVGDGGGGAAGRAADAAGPPRRRKPTQQQRRLSAPELAWQFDLVVTTFSRLSAEWGRRRSPDPAAAVGGCPLLSVHWLRVVVDEGHLLSSSSVSSASSASASGASGSSSGSGGGAITSKMQMACALKAERRWVLTGTPAPGRAGSGGGGGGGGENDGVGGGFASSRSSASFSHSANPFLPLRPGYSGASALSPLLAFLKHNPYELRRRLDLGIIKPFESGSPWGAQALRDLLTEVSIRSAKADLSIIPRLVRLVTPVRFRRSHALSYNALVEAVERALLLADWGDPDHRESLLAKRNAPWAREVAANLRAAACVAGAISPVPKLADVHETLQLLADRQGVERPADELSSGPPWLPAGHPLRRVEAALLLRGGGTKPGAGEEWGGLNPSAKASAAASASASASLTSPPPRPPRFRRGETACDRCSLPCRLPLATPCACLLCVECAAPSRERCTACGTAFQMQSVSDKARALTNPNPKWAVPIEAIEWQPSYSQAGALGASGGHWSPAWATTKSSKVAHLVRRLVEYGVAPPPPSDSDAKGSGGENAGGLRVGGDGGSGVGSPLPLPPPRTSWTPRAKAIVFSQHWPHILLVGRALDEAGVHSVTLQGRFSPSMRAAAVDEFRHDGSCGVLVMDTSGAVGLDLSFARFVFVMDPIADGALEAQVVARAHRMGATAEVVVETLVMKGTAEEEVMRVCSAAASAAASAARSPSKSAPFSSSSPCRGKKKRRTAEGEEEENGFAGDGEEDEEDVSAAARLRARVLLSVRRVLVPEAEGSDDEDEDDDEDNYSYARGVTAAAAAGAGATTGTLPRSPGASMLAGGGAGWRNAGSAAAAAAAAGVASAAARARAAASAVAASLAAAPSRRPVAAAANPARRVRFAVEGEDDDELAPPPQQRRTVRFAD